MNDFLPRNFSHPLSSLNLIQSCDLQSSGQIVEQRLFNPQLTSQPLLCIRTSTIILFLLIIAVSLLTLCNTDTHLYHPAALGAMSTQTGARGASRFRGRNQPRADTEPRSDSERREKRAPEKANFTVRGGALTRGNPFARPGDRGGRNQVVSKARGAESQKRPDSSHQSTRGSRTNGSTRGDRGASRSHTSSNSERSARTSKEDGIQGHFVEYLRGGLSAGSRGGTSTRGGSVSKNWRNARQEGGSYMQNMSDLYQTVCIPSPLYTDWELQIVTCVSWFH